MLRRRKDDVLSLPPKLRTWLPTRVAEGTASREIREVVNLLLARTDGRPIEPDAADADAHDRHARIHLLALLTRAREKLAAAKASTTREFVAGAVDQGEKVIVFSCFEAPLNELAASFGDQAVTVTGKTPSAARQSLVDRFQSDHDVRVFLANIVAGGIGLNLTAATQVVFNDLDWVPANHWQAEDRAYRIGQTKTVNVTYVVGEGTIDDFVQAVLETKAALVRTVVEGEAIGGDLGGGVLEELERALGALSAGLADTGQPQIDEGAIEAVLQEATSRWRASMSVARSTRLAGSGLAGTGNPHDLTPPEHLASLRKALETLARVLAGPKALRFRVKSSSHAGAFYEVSVDGADVACTCPGFEYRGQCRHAREVKAAMAAGGTLPRNYVAAG
jgi:hypothetical protein